MMPMIRSNTGQTNEPRIYSPGCERGAEIAIWASSSAVADVVAQRVYWMCLFLGPPPPPEAE